MAPTKSDAKPKGNRDIRNQRQTKPTIQSSTSNPTSGQETLHQQREGGNRTFSAGTTAYTHSVVTETFSPESQRSTADKQSPYEATIRHHDLLGVGSQFFSTGGIQHEPRTAPMEAAFACPYHGRILQGHPTNPSPGQGLGPMERYIAEGPSERHAILHRTDAATRSRHNSCRCVEYMQNRNDTGSQAQK